MRSVRLSPSRRRRGGADAGFSKSTRDIQRDHALYFQKRLAEILAKGFTPTQAPPRERMALPKTLPAPLCYKETSHKSVTEGSRKLPKGVLNEEFWNAPRDFLPEVRTEILLHNQRYRYEKRFWI